MAGWVCRLNRPSEAFKFSLYSNEHVKEAVISSSVNFTSSIEDIVVIDNTRLVVKWLSAGIKSGKCH